MNDEANSHWISIVQQLTEGQLWIHNNFNISVKSGWAIDPFGESSSMALLLKEAGLENMLLQRTHYEVKKRLASTKQLEFRWRQLWGDFLIDLYASDACLYNPKTSFFLFQITTVAVRYSLI